MSNRRFFWLKLNENFFHRNDIKIIESQDNGAEYVIFYLKLLAESIEMNGNLRFNDLLPFNEKMLSTVTNTNIDVVRTALKLFQSLGLIEIKSDNTIFMVETPGMTGSETASTIRSRRSRAKKAANEIEEPKKAKTTTNEVKTIGINEKEGKPLQCNNSATNCNVELELELDLEKDLEKELERELNKDIDSKDNKKITPALINSLFKTLKLKSSAEDFYNYYDAREWKFPNGNQIRLRALESLVKRWEAMEVRFQKQNINNGKGSSKAPDIDKPEWLDEYIEEIGNMKG